MVEQRHERFVLVTGASTGIGAACVLGCAREGMTVFAGVRNLQDGEALRERDDAVIIPLQLDVTDSESIGHAARVIEQRVGKRGLSGLVNNAGIAIGCPLEVIPIAQLRMQMEVNVIGQIAVTQAVLPLIRLAHGRIVNMGSIAGRGTIPMMGPYSASKFALEALTDALRMELYRWGIEVSIIEPGAVATPIWEKSLKAADYVEASVSEEGKRLYREAAQRVRQSVDEAAQRAITVDAVVDAIIHALTAPRPRTRYLVGRDAKIRAFMVKWFPDRLQDWVLRKALKLPSRD